MSDRSSLVGIAVVFVIGLAYGYGLAHFIDSSYYDCAQSSPGMASLGAIVYGAIAGLIILPVVGVAFTQMAPRISRGSVVAGCAFIVWVFPVAAVAGFVLHHALWPLPVPRPC